MSARNLAGDSVSALVVLLDLRPRDLPVHIEELRAVLRREAATAMQGWETEAATTNDHDRGTRCRRWARAIEAAWDLARHELDVASGLRRPGMVA